MLAETKKDALARLKTAEGHIRAVRKMVEDERYCMDVAKQINAVIRALEKTNAVVLRGHLHSCVREGMKNGDDEQLINELVELFEQRKV